MKRYDFQNPFRIMPLKGWLNMTGLLGLSVVLLFTIPPFGVGFLFIVAVIFTYVIMDACPTSPKHWWCLFVGTRIPIDPEWESVIITRGHTVTVEEIKSPKYDEIRAWLDSTIGNWRYYTASTEIVFLRRRDAAICKLRYA